MDFEQRKKQALDLIQNDNYLKAFEAFSDLFMERPEDPEIMAISIFLLDRIIEGNYDFEPSTTEQYIFRGVSRFYKQELEGSISDYEKALSLNPMSDYAMKCKAFSLRFQGQLDLANGELEKAIRINPAGEYYDDIAENYSILGDYSRALIYHEKAVTHSPENSRLWYNYGVVLGETGNVEEAIKKFDKAIELWPEYPDALHNQRYYSELLNKNR